MAMIAGQARATACLTGDDLQGGLRAMYLDGSVVDYHPAGEGLVQVVERPDPARPEAIAFLSRYGLYDLEAQALAGDAPEVGKHLSYSYATAGGAEPPLPEAGTTWLGQSVTTYADGAHEVADAVFVYGREGSVSLGGCDYRSIPVTASFLMGQAWASQDYQWLPDLGIGLLTGRQGSDAARGSVYRLSGLTRIVD